MISLKENTDSFILNDDEDFFSDSIEGSGLNSYVHLEGQFRDHFKISNDEGERKFILEQTQAFNYEELNNDGKFKLIISICDRICVNKTLDFRVLDINEHQPELMGFKLDDNDLNQQLKNSKLDTLANGHQRLTFYQSDFNFIGDQKEIFIGYLEAGDQDSGDDLRVGSF